MGNRHAPIARWQPTMSDISHILSARLLTISVSADRFAGRRIYSTRTLVKRYVRRGEFLRAVNLSSSELERHADTIDVSSAASDTNIRDVTTANRYVRRSSQRKYKTKAQSRYLRRHVKKKKKSGIASASIWRRRKRTRSVRWRRRVCSSQRACLCVRVRMCVCMRREVEEGE